MASLLDKTFTYDPSIFPIYKRVALIMQKYNMGEVLENVIKTHNSEMLVFAPFNEISYETNHINKFGSRKKYKQYKGDCILQGNNTTCVINTYVGPLRQSGITIIYDQLPIQISDSIIKKYDKYLSKNISNKYITVKGNIGCSREIIEDNEGNQEYLMKLKSSNSFIINLKHFEETCVYELAPLLLGISQYDNELKPSIELHIADFAKTRTWIQPFLEDTNQPTSSATREFIDYLLYMKQNNITNIKYGNINITYDLQNKNLSGSFLGIQLFRETSFNKYKYEYHPGICFITNLLEKRDLMTDFYLLLEKQIFKKI